MFRCHRFILAALLALGCAPCAIGPAVCAGDEPLEGVVASPDTWIDELADPPVEETAPAPSGPRWPRTWDLGPGVTMRLRGRIDADSIWASQSPANVATYGDLGDVVGLRRARIGTEGKLGDDGRYVSEIDLASGFVVPRDVYFALGHRQEAGEGQFGHFREPFSLEGGTSARFLAFMERSPINVLDPARNWGLALFREKLDTNTALGFGVFHAGTDAGDFQGGPGSTVGFTGRLTTAPINENDGERLLHFGLALSERIPEYGVIIIKQQPRSPLLELGDSSTSAFVPEIRIPARFQQLVNLQFAAARGPLWTQAEWYGTYIDQIGGGPVFFHGCHVDGGYFLTGEHRKYDSTQGVLGAIHVNRPVLCSPAERDRVQGWGAWELTARYAYLDFFDRDTPPGPSGQLVGTQLPQWTFGVNWYLSDRVRMLFNYSYDTPREMTTGVSSANIFGTRLAVYW